MRGTPKTTPDASDNESLITVEEEPQPLSPSVWDRLLSKASPRTALEAIAKFGDVMSGKRKAPDLAQPPAKRLREETRLVPGLALPVTFHRFLHDLFRLDMECPLSLFTTSSLRYIATNAATLPTKKINAPEGVDKRPVVLDVGDFQKNVLDENNMDRGQWIEASKNFLQFIREAQPERLQRFADHFAFFEQHQDGEDLFPAILKTDIKLRSQYTLSPFIFDVAFYSSHLQTAIVDLKIARARFTQPAAPLPPQAPRLPASAVLRVGRGPLLRGGGGFPARPSFRPGTGVGARDPVCLICARSGHTGPTCSSRSLPDGKATHSEYKNDSIVTKVSRDAPTTESVCTCAPSAETGPTTHSAGLANATPSLPNDEADIFLLSILPSPASDDEIFSRVITPYDPDAFFDLLSSLHLLGTHGSLPDKLRRGFPMGDFPVLNETKIFPNHPSTADHDAFVNGYLHEEVEAGRMSGPFSQEKTESILKGPFQCSPIIIAVQPQGPGEPDKLRLCRHLSKGDRSHPSTNFFVDKDKFPTKFGTASDVAEIIASAPPGTQAMVLDIAKFHRTCPILPAHKRWFVLRGPKGFYIDHCCPFGCASSSSNAGLIGSAIIDIWVALGFAPANRYEDDILSVRQPAASRIIPSGRPSHFWYPATRSDALHAIHSLHIPWHPTKWTEYLFELVYIGFLWNFPDKTVALPEDKRLKFLRRIHDFRSICKSGKCQLLHVQKIHGSLCHLSFVHPQGRSYLPALTSFIIAFEGNTFKTRRPPPSVYSSLSWWETTLSVPRVSRSIAPKGPRQDRLLYVDASTAWGIGIWLDGHWGAWKGSGDWKSRQRHIGWLETVAIELLVLTLDSLDLENAYLLVHSDNQGVIGAFDKGRSRNADINLSLRRIFVTLAARNISLDLVYIPSASNPRRPSLAGCSPRQRLPYFPSAMPAARSSLLFCTFVTVIITRDRVTGLFSTTMSRDLSHHLPPPVPMPQRPAPAEIASRLPSLTTPTDLLASMPSTQPRVEPFSHPCTRPNFHLPLPSQPNLASPKRGNGIAPSEFRPPALAKDRLRTWSSPFSRAKEAELRASLPADEVNRLYAAIFAAFAPDTQSTYAAGLLRFHQYCDNISIAEEARMPASAALITAFVSRHVGLVGGDTVKSWLSGLRAWHDVHQAAWPGNEPWVKLIRRTANKQGTAFKKAQRGPVTVQHLVALRSKLKLNIPFDAAVWGRGLRSLLGMPQHGGARASSFHIPWTKSTRERDGTVILTDRDDPLCPVEALQNHLFVNGNIPGEAPLFSFRQADGRWLPMTKPWFLTRCTEIWKECAMLAVAGHSFRIGGSTELLLAGVPCDIVAATGGWTSLAFLLYWRKLEHIIAMAVGKAYDKKKIEEVALAFDRFRIEHNITLLPEEDC
ncbi:hypothetical protein MIND_00983700 [Mycena indigotica]|uniref:Uncharacterized protein n=1 Tax=Mycena indigotica TaxID=2126181 RepID=A0A8H6SDN0_9AGAR|nr:uncharacterized protein MIND_00983700 [Mycena indigotica]KAF7297499.1 hypothetical protein MIND_00983700 [Mycena indigotica]